jgi:ABC-type antimicrobial peptide transport system permease subunit
MADDYPVDRRPWRVVVRRLRTRRWIPARGTRTEVEAFPSGLSPSDVASEALAGLTARPLRMALTVLGTVIGLSALVATLGLSRTAANRIVGRFDELAATSVEVAAKPAGLAAFTAELPWDSGVRMARLNGVVAAGTISVIHDFKGLISATPINDPSRATRFKMDVMAASPTLFRAVRANLSAGRYPDEGHSLRGDRVALLGGQAAEKLGIVRLDTNPAISIGDQTYVVAGIIGSVMRRPEIMTSVIVPEGTARKEFHVASPEKVVVETRIGAASLISRQAPLALHPGDPNGLKVSSPEEPQRAKAGVQSDLNTLFLLLGGVSLLVGAIGIANITLISVMERTGEIGLRRALGATSRDITTQFLLESGMIGVIGGILGASLGTMVVVIVAAANEWTPVLDPLVPLGAPLLGAFVGVMAGIYPAFRAARLEPVEALRAGT